ncbi:hypothetical protein QK891_00790 [Escherichia coli]
MRKLAVIFPRLTKSEQTAYGNALGFSYAGQQFLGSGHALKDVDEFTSRSQVTPGVQRWPVSYEKSLLSSTDLVRHRDDD